MFFFAVFWGKQLEFTSRSLEELWNLGHILFFFLITLFLIKYQPRKIKGRWLIQVLYIFIITSVIGICIELGQAILASGIPDLRDLYKNLIGTLVGYLTAKRGKKSFVLSLLKVLSAILILFEFVPIIKAVTEEIQSYKEFPVLADFENEAELDRWDYSKQIVLDSTYYSHGKSSLKVEFDTTRYSTISFIHFPADWSEFRYLKFDMYSPSSDSLLLTCRIHDSEHNYDYKDRFNYSFFLSSGWNEIDIDLVKVKRSSGLRSMNMENIQSLGLFSSRLVEQRTIYLDYIRLEK